MNILEFILLGLACWRITSLFVKEDGPFKMFKRLRELTGVSHYDDGAVCEVPDKFLCELITCTWCLSVWVGAALVAAYIFLPSVAIYFALWLSLSTITIMVNEWLAVLK